MIRSYRQHTPENVRISIEVPVKKPSQEQLIKIEKPGKKIINKTKKETMPKKHGTAELIITEKPAAAEKIAAFVQIRYAELDKSMFMYGNNFYQHREI